MSTTLTEDQNMWARQFAENLAHALKPQLLGGARVIEHEQTPAPEDLCTPIEAKRYDAAIGQDFYRIGKSKKPDAKQGLFRFVSWHQKWFADASCGNNQFAARAYIENFEYLPEAADPSSPRNGGQNSEPPKKVLSAFYLDAREFFRLYTPTTRLISELDGDPLEAAEIS